MMKLRCYIIYVLLATVFAAGCQRRALEDEAGDLARIPMHIDWSQSGLNVANVHNVSAWFFPHDGRPSFEMTFEGNLTDVEALLPAGSYSIIVFNEVVNFRWSSLQFLGLDKYETSRVAARTDTFRGLETKAEELDVRKSPDTLAVWSCDKFDVSPEMVRISSLGSRAEGQPALPEISVELKALTRAVAVKAYVQNLTSAMRCTGTLSGVVGEVLLSTRKSVVTNVAHIFIMNNRLYDKVNPNHGYIHANLLIFNTGADFQKILQINFELTDGTKSSPDPFDVTTKVDEDVPKVNVNVGIGLDGDPEDHPIILPKTDVQGEVGVDDWTNNIIPIT